MLAQVPRRPSVVDSTYAVAAAILARLKITVVSRDSADTTARPGTVLRQSPPARTVVRPGAVDTLYVVRPKTARFVPVPDVRGQPYAQAADRIRSVGLVPVGPALSLADSGRARVVVQSPTAPNRVPVGYRVTLRVSVDPRAIVPQLVGSDIAHARFTLRDTGLELGPATPVFDDHYPPGVITHQDPEAGALAQRGSAVRVWVSRGPPPDTTIVVVPRLIGLGLDSAAATLASVRLKLDHADTVAVQKDAGLVVHQLPHPGDTLHIDDAVVVTIGAPRSASVPPLIGRSRDSAAAALTRAGLALGAVRVAVDTAKPDGVVVAQSLPPGERTALGTAIDIDVNERPTRVAVPEVRRRRYTDAVATLIDSGLSADSPTYKPEGAAGVVLDQRPIAGTLVAPGSPVALEVGGHAPPSPDSTVVVPAVVDSPVVAALRRLDRAGLRNVVVDSEKTSVPAGAWLTDAQAPAPGEQVLPGILVRLKARPVRTVVKVRVPRVLGMTEDGALIEAEGERFPLRVVGRARSLRLGDAVVATQQPAPFAEVAPGTTLEVTISDPVPALPVAAVAGIVVAALLFLGLRTRPVPDHPEPTPAAAAPSFRTTLGGDLPSVAAGAGGRLLQAEVTVRLDRGVAYIDVTQAQAGFVQSDRIITG